MTIHRLIADETETAYGRQCKPCRDLVEQAEKLALADLDEPLHIPALCRALAVSERSLRKAFRRIHGLPPCRHLRMLRLSRARRALLSADCKRMTVTEIATCFGFVELGRFSVNTGRCLARVLHRRCLAHRRPRLVPRPLLPRHFWCRPVRHDFGRRPRCDSGFAVPPPASSRGI